MGVGEFIVAIAIIVGTYLLLDKTLKLIRWKLEYDTTVKKDIDEVNDFIKDSDLER